jgi:hypothetical protein
MAFSKSGICSGKKFEGTVKMPGKPSSALSGVEKPCLPDECEGQIVDSSHDAAHITDGHAGCIFTKGDVTAIYQWFLRFWRICKGVACERERLIIPYSISQVCL